MKKVLNLSLIFAILAMMVISGCKKDDPEPSPEGDSAYTVLADFLTTEGLDLTDLLSGWVVPAAPISEDGIVDTDNDYTIPDYYVFDIRNEDTYNAGHINGAIRVDLNEVVGFAADYTDKPILVVCNSGQTAGHAVMALRLAGYSDAKF